jgi:hypothetical protein
MELMNKFFLALLMILGLATPANAAEKNLEISFGPNVDRGSAFSTKYFAVGYGYNFDPVSIHPECGFWNKDGLTWTCALQGRINIEANSGIFSFAGFGPAWVSRVDDRLSTPFEFSLTGALGLRQRGWSVALRFQHFSNAGIKQPNVGYDFALGSVQFPL